MGFTSTALRMSTGPIVWALHFLAIYGLAGLACARGWHAMVGPGVALLSVLAALPLLVMIAMALRRRADFEWAMSGGLAAFALVAIVWEALPVLWVETCG